MSVSLTRNQIINLCGLDNYEKGAAYASEGKVSVERSGSRYSATVSASRPYVVHVRLGTGGSVEPECGCLSSLAEDQHCKHIAAALISIVEASRKGRLRTKPAESAGAKIYLQSAPDRELVEHLLGLFGEDTSVPVSFGSPLRDDRMALNVEFGILLLPARDGRHTISLDMKIGLQKLHPVQHLAGFLSSVEEQRECQTAKSFRYTPKQHRFSPQDEPVIEALVSSLREDERYRSAMASGALPSLGQGQEGNERFLVVPPHSWARLLTVLSQASNAKTEVFGAQGRERSRPSTFGKPVPGPSHGRLPLQFKLDRSHEDDGYSLTASGIREAIVLEVYGMAFMGGVFYPLPSARLVQLAKLKRLLFSGIRDTADDESVTIAAEQIDRFMDKVVPSLTKLGELQLAPAVADRIWVQPLKARLYLDRIRGRLLAGLEFQYGDIIINPLENGDKPRGSERILMRDSEKEKEILRLFQQEGFVKTEGGYVMEGDDDEFLFLHEIVPQLEKLLTVYATAAVKLRILNETIPPKLSLTWDEKTDWLEFKFKMDGISAQEIKAVVEAVEAKKPYYKLATGALLPLRTEAFEAMLRVMNGVGLHHLALHGDMARVPIGKAAALLDMPGSDAVKLGRSLKELLDSLRDPERLDFPLPEALGGILRDYQKTGYQWMKTLAAYRFGGILADEMGLGKTIQSIAFLLSVADDIRASGRPALIVCPASLMYNWRGELTRFAPGLRTVIADGSKEERLDALDWTIAGGDSAGGGVSRGKPDFDKDGEGDGRPDVVIVSYPLLRRDWETYAAHSFHTLILDEAQAFKNVNTQTAGAVRSLKAEYRFALTGTPIENRLDELWSIFRAVFPALFPDPRGFGELTREEVARRSRPFLMRRLKSEVLKELPEKIETLQSSELLPEQKKLYAAYLAKLREDSLKHLDNGDEFGKARIRILAGITRLRQLCCHPALFVEGYQGSSAKFEQLLELVDQCRSAGRRALVFSQFTEMLGLISRELGYKGVPYFYLDGSTPAAERVELCSRFNEGERDLFLLSLKAGGTGLNLTGADTVILYDLWWNPAVEQQAADRAHRIGQRNVVQIIRLVSEGTVEDKMVELQQRKLTLIDDVLSQDGLSSSSLTEADLRELLSLGNR
ncbi:helicase SNF [Paenibacillus agaridevorans]|uniref:Helicase SNF n=1 Tax=Paenibacillus agaridevorans TaxID=171404 RepID=A0A2R5ER29_9BACL|nr:DEAD/DEAH box helicase [Paenibacillus agaridevorans]GBG09140.1 helicase SNF [Paenibacillus agaridevorans]